MVTSLIGSTINPITGDYSRGASGYWIENGELSYPVNEGWLYSKDKKAIKLFASFDRDEDGTITFGDRTMIPTSCVKKMTKLS